MTRPVAMIKAILVTAVLLAAALAFVPTTSASDCTPPGEPPLGLYPLAKWYAAAMLYNQCSGAPPEAYEETMCQFVWGATGCPA